MRRAKAREPGRCALADVDEERAVAMLSGSSPERRSFFSPAVERAEKRAHRVAIARMCSGVVPQQPRRC